MNKLNTFEMLSKENANEMYSHLNVIVEELNGFGLNQMSPVDVVRKILCVLPTEKYGHIVPCFTKEISQPPHQHPSWGRSTLMRCTCTSTPKIALHQPRKKRRTWPSRLLTRASQRRMKLNHQLQVMMTPPLLSW